MRPRIRVGKAQGAIEYLTTYMWAIILIAVVIGVLFQLGFFSGGTLAPRAAPGACQVYRPSGPGSTQSIKLTGTCSGQLPQYVSSFVASSSSRVLINDAAPLRLNGPFTIAFWGEITDNNAAGYPGFIVKGASGVVGMGYLIFYGSPGGAIVSPFFKRDNVQYQAPGSVPALQKWYFYAVTYDGSSTLTIYENSQSAKYTGVTFATNVDTSLLFLGRGDDYGNSLMSNVQFYNTSLSASHIQSLYTEGIGGAPLDLQHLVAWWPLNGNGNDYSGNGQTANSVNGITYNTQWINSYTPH